MGCWHVNMIEWKIYSEEKKRKRKKYETQENMRGNKLMRKIRNTMMKISCCDLPERQRMGNIYIGSKKIKAG